MKRFVRWERARERRARRAGSAVASAREFQSASRTMRTSDCSATTSLPGSIQSSVSSDASRANSSTAPSSSIRVTGWPPARRISRETASTNSEQ